MNADRTLARNIVDELHEERATTLARLLALSDEQCRQRVESEGREKTVNQVLRQFASHELDHFQHLIRLLQDRGVRLTEATLILMKANAALAEFEALVLSLSDEEFLAQGPNEGDWNAEQVVRHVIGNERRYREDILRGLEPSA